MNSQLKTILLTVLTLSCFVIALVELSGVSQTALFNKYHIGDSNNGLTTAEANNRQQEIAAMPKTTVQYIDSFYNFGEIKEGDVVKHSFRFKNTGTNPLLISKADVSCGCTVPSFSKEPIAPGAEGTIEVQYNSKGHPGHQHKNVIVHSNAQLEAMSIGFEADVK
ncbi:MAG: hypothetical protein BGO69_07815 [Bacteroidetes bacterium 46-16]|nr:MAG: hypothetical protein BGO69_07815 [Bacteroidetes bacterium 46-16]